MNLGDRQKRYEMVARTRLTPKVPVIMRVDMKAGGNLNIGDVINGVVRGGRYKNVFHNNGNVNYTSQYKEPEPIKDEEIFETMSYRDEDIVQPSVPDYKRTNVQVAVDGIIGVFEGILEIVMWVLDIIPWWAVVAIVLSFFVSIKLLLALFVIGFILWMVFE